MGDIGNAGAMAGAITATTSDPYADIVVGVFPGEGIGPEVVDAALVVLDVLSSATSRRIDVRRGGAIGTEALRLRGKSLTEEAVAFAEATFADGGALFCGAGGARFVYELRARFDLFCKLTPLQPSPELTDAALLRAERLLGVDIVAVRENSGGLYFGRERVFNDAGGQTCVEMSFSYRLGEILRILRVAGRLALVRRGKVSVVVKRDGVAAISDLWLKAMEEARQEFGGDWEVLDIDNAAYQLIANPRHFDVMVSPNMFGDVLADCGSALLGSRGMSYSGNFSSNGNAVYQTGHGAAYDIAGTGTANPVGQILSLAMMLEESFGWAAGARLVRKSVAQTLARGVRTADIRGPHGAVSCREMAGAICGEMIQLVEAAA
jgi:3-isopropylmalate dehydrogenase